MAKKYRALAGLTFPKPQALKSHKSGKELEPDEWARVEAGKVTDAIPSESVRWLLKDGLIEEVRP